MTEWKACNVCKDEACVNCEECGPCYGIRLEAEAKLAEAKCHCGCPACRNDGPVCSYSQLEAKLAEAETLRMEANIARAEMAAKLAAAESFQRKRIIAVGKAEQAYKARIVSLELENHNYEVNAQQNYERGERMYHQLVAAEAEVKRLTAWLAYCRYNCVAGRESESYSLCPDCPAWDIKYPGPERPSGDGKGQAGAMTNAKDTTTQEQHSPASPSKTPAVGDAAASPRRRSLRAPSEGKKHDAISPPDPLERA